MFNEVGRDIVPLELRSAMDNIALPEARGKFDFVHFDKYTQDDAWTLPYVRPLLAPECHLMAWTELHMGPGLANYFDLIECPFKLIWSKTRRCTRQVNGINSAWEPALVFSSGSRPLSAQINDNYHSPSYLGHQEKPLNVLVYFFRPFISSTTRLLDLHHGSTYPARAARAHSPEQIVSIDISKPIS